MRLHRCVAIWRFTSGACFPGSTKTGNGVPRKLSCLRLFANLQNSRRQHGHLIAGTMGAPLGKKGGDKLRWRGRKKELRINKGMYGSTRWVLGVRISGDNLASRGGHRAHCGRVGLDGGNPSLNVRQHGSPLIV